MQNQVFTKLLLEWFEQNDRPLPWKGEKNPYFIWLSEIILQQTRVEQGLPYFNKFCEKYPTIKDLANAPEDEVMKLWEGLGYYSRARNLHFTAKYIAKDLKGKFPKTYKNIVALKGVGPYTAAAIASFAYGLPYAVVDGNVYRVLSRVFGIETPIDSTAGKKQFQILAQDLLGEEQAGVYNQAIMDFGATQCTPKNPKCYDCPMKEDCVAFNNQLLDLLPIKEKKIKKKQRFFNYIVLNAGEKILIRKRIEKDIWQNLYEFPMVESPKILDEKELSESELFQQLIGKQSYQVARHSLLFRQTLTHQKIVAIFWEINLQTDYKTDLTDYTTLKRTAIDQYAFPKIIDSYIKNGQTLHFQFPI